MHDPDTARRHPPAQSISQTAIFKIARLAALSSRTGRKLFRQKFDLSLNEWRVLGLIQEHGPVLASRLSAILVMDKGQMSRVTARLIDLGLVQAQDQAEDARIKLMIITPKGQSLHDKVLQFALSRNEVALAPLSAADTRHLITLLDRVLIHYDSLTTEGVDLR